MDSEDENADDDFLLIEMDLARPVGFLKILMSQLLSTHNITSACPVFLKGIRLSDSTTLVNKCVIKTGQVLIKCRIKPDCDEVAIEIDDVLLASENDEKDADSVASYSNSAMATIKSSFSSAHEIGGYLWKVDSAFTQEQTKRHMPSNPFLWSPADVRLWLGWARSVFRSSTSEPNEDMFGDLASISITGPELCSLPREKLTQLVAPKQSHDRDRLSDLLFAHFTLLKQQHCIYRPWPLSRDTAVDSLPPTAKRFAVTPVRVDPPYIERNKDAKPVSSDKPCLWRFILDCLTEPTNNSQIPSVIHWGDVAKSEFVIEKPDEFARIWSEKSGRNGKTTLTETVGRALRMYSSENVILSRVSTSKGLWTYRFVADLEQLIGYSAAQLQALSSGKNSSKNMNK